MPIARSAFSPECVFGAPRTLICIGLKLLLVADVVLVREPTGSGAELPTKGAGRASRRCIVNLCHVKKPQLDKDGGLIFVLRDGKQVAFSRRQAAFFRTTRGL